MANSKKKKKKRLWYAGFLVEIHALSCSHSKKRAG
jgi:hypothetical protein